MQIKRKLAIDMIAKMELLLLSETARCNILMDIFNEDEQYKQIKDVFQEKLNGHIIKYLKNDYYGVANDYLAFCIKKYLNIFCTVVGKVEALYPCPCCRYKTLPHLGEYDICKLCYWECDSISQDETVYSPANRATLRGYRQNFYASEALKASETSIQKYLL